MGVRLVGELRRLSRGLAQAARIAEYPALKKAIAEGVASRTIRRFNEQRGPDGTPWPPLSPKTLMGEIRPRDRLGGGLSRKAQERMAKRKALIKTGRLRNSISYAVRGRAIHVGTNVLYARIHQFGGKAGRGRAATIPARPYLGISREDLEEIEALLLDFLGRHT